MFQGTVTDLKGDFNYLYYYVLVCVRPPPFKQLLSATEVDLDIIIYYAFIILSNQLVIHVN